jgi:hypothetical protein
MDLESRKIWQDVTINLKAKQSELATKAKNRIEQKQREEAKYRKENNIEWKTKYFDQIDNGEWIFKNSLSKRLV